MVETENDTPSPKTRVARDVLEREARRRRVLITASLPVCLLIGVALFSSMPIDSIYIVGGGAVAGLLAWAGLINLISLERGSPAYRLLLAGDRTAEEEQAITEHGASFGKAASADPNRSDSTSIDREIRENPDQVVKRADVDDLAERTEQSSLKK